MVHFRVGTAHLEKGNYPDALRDLLQAEALNPKEALIQNNLGLAYFMRQRYELSESHLRKALKLESTFTDAKNNLARVLIERSNFKEARSHLDQVLGDLTYPQPGKAYVNYGLSYFRESNYTEAKEAFLKAISYERENCLAQNYYGRCLLELKDAPKAIQALDKAAAFCLKVNFDEPIYFSAIAYFRLGDRLKAQSRLETLVQKNSPYKDKAETMLEILRK
jgi:tetratricopeptide (TPR) repeat protein